MTTPPLPLLLLTGFLGAGKTTLLRRVIAAEQAAGRPLGVIVNELGNLGIDAALVDSPGPVRELLEGCVCCGLQDDLLTSLLSLADEGVQRVVIELSGGAEPASVLELLQVPDLAGRYAVPGIVGVVDASMWEEWGSMRAVLEAQVAFAQQIAINKSYLVSAEKLDTMKAELRHINQFATITTTVEAALTDTDLWASAPPVTSPSRTSPTDAHRALHVVQIPLAGSVARADLVAWLAALPAEVWRVKGIVELQEEPGCWLVQGVGATRRLYRMPGEIALPRELVLIGPWVGELGVGEIG